MLPLSTLRILAFAALALLASSCDQEENAPQPTEPVRVVATPLKMHTVAVRYHLEALDSTFQLPTISPNITVDYERVVPQGNSAYKLLEANTQHHEQEVTSALKEVQLPSIVTYADVTRPKITVTIWEEQASPPGSGIGYQVICELLTDGKSTGTTTYVAVAGRTTPLFVATQTEVSH
ncbi:hypothetical protein SAMN00120144_2673 [Hymenobacter roseosalivarius DSM 11622]|uniref:Lipoprotein n=1 Tax=Hymenobacter roseosalivarius DSM 11622 TaxID=645990 RepID=A0A1W1VJV2_9BACT|nr:hypothetical protein [Hymenobacter roseosalivarius]SMB93655.1 hypothetical protein SAMN00120144_2673 [Hymenobacter roseosalivarius DSM 11622]